MTEKDYHNCHFCGDFVRDGFENVTEMIEVRDYSGDRGVPSSPNIKLGLKWQSYKRRHWLSDCRPDLVKHEPGEKCTWYGMEHKEEKNGQPGCYAYKNRDTKDWDVEHIHFYEDGPM